MTEIKILKGTYGYRPNTSGSVHAKTAADEPFQVSDSEAERLVRLGVAAYTDGNGSESEQKHLDPYAEFGQALMTFVNKIAGVADENKALSLALEMLLSYAEEIGADWSPSGVATLDNDKNDGKAGDNTPKNENGAEGEDDGDGADSKNSGAPDDDGDDEGDDDDNADIPEYSVDMPQAELKELFEECGLTFRVGMSKAEMVAALDEYYAALDDDGENAPDLEAEGPVT